MANVEHPDQLPPHRVDTNEQVGEPVSLHGQDDELDPEFEAALTAALSLDATERIERYSQLANQLMRELETPTLDDPRDEGKQ